MAPSFGFSKPTGTKTGNIVTLKSLGNAIKGAVEKERKRYEVPEGKSADEYKALAQKYSNKYREMVLAARNAANGINLANFKKRAEQLLSIANKEGFENPNPYIGDCGDSILMKKNEQICTLVVIITVLITAFILLGCYLVMRGGMSGNGDRRIDTDVTYKP